MIRLLARLWLALDPTTACRFAEWLADGTEPNDLRDESDA